MSFSQGTALSLPRVPIESGQRSNLLITPVIARHGNAEAISRSIGGLQILFLSIVFFSADGFAAVYFDSLSGNEVRIFRGQENGSAH